MNLSDFQGMLDEFDKKVDEIVQACETVSSEGLVVDISTEAGKQKFEQLKAKTENFSISIENRMKGMKNKVVKSLNKTYNEATKAMEPYKTIAEMALAITAPGADLGKLATFASKVVNTLQAIANHYMNQYTEPYNTTLAIAQVAVKLGTSMNKLSGLSVPNIKVLQNGEEITWTPPLPSPPSITLADITGGAEEAETPSKPEPEQVTIPDRQYYFSGYNELSKSDITWVGPYAVAEVPMVAYDYIYKDEKGEERFNESVTLNRVYMFNCDTTPLGFPKHKGKWLSTDSWMSCFRDEEDFKDCYFRWRTFAWSGPIWVGFNPQANKNRDSDWTRVRRLLYVGIHTSGSGGKEKTEVYTEWGNEFKNIRYIANELPIETKMVKGSNYWIS